MTMQLVKTSRDQLLRPLQTVSGVVERKNTLPILSNILIKKEGANVSFLATDTEIQIKTSADIGVGDENFAITVNGDKIVRLVQRHSEGSEILLNYDDKKLAVKAGGRSNVKMQTLSADDFPLVTETEEYTAHVEISQKELKALLDMVAFSMALKDIRFYLQGLLLIVDGDVLSVVATDGHRLAFCQSGIAQSVTKQKVIIPRKTVSSLQNLLEDIDDLVQIDISSSQIKFNFGEVELISKVVDGEFPDYNRVIPKGYKNRFEVAREELKGALDRASLMASDKFKGIRCIIDADKLRITSTNTEQEEAVEELDISYNGDMIDIGFNVNYLADALNLKKVDNIVIELNDANSSALITIPGYANFKYVVMPMRI